MVLTRRSLMFLAGALPSMKAPSAFAQSDFPSRRTTIVVPFAPGGANDIVARLIGSKVFASSNQPVLIDNKGGAGGAIGVRTVASAAPDGYTILCHSNSIIIQPFLVKDAGYDPLRDFAPVSQLTQFPLVMVVHPSVPAKTFPEFLAYARAKGSDLFYGSAGVGASQHLASELFNRMAGTKMQHVPFKGNGPATAAVMAGEIQVMLDIIPTALNLGANGAVRPLAVTGSERAPQLPQLPTIRESGVPDYVVTFWQGMFLPKNTPAPIVARWVTELKKVLQDKDVQTRLIEQGFRVVGSSTAELIEVMQSDTARWGKVIADAGIQLQ